MLIFAHRGLKLEYPENTMLAYRAAADAGFGIELDIRLTADGHLACIHNPDTEHIADQKLVVRESTLAQLQALEVRTPTSDRVGQIPDFLGEVVPLIAAFGHGQIATIHVKEDEQGDQQLQMLAAAFAEHNLYDKAILFDLTLETAAKVRVLDPRICIFISVGEERFAPSIYLWEDLADHSELYDGVWWDEWKTPGSEYTAERAAEILAAGKTLYVISPELHTVHGHPHAQSGYEQDWRNFIAWGAHGICTAHPRQLRELLG